MHGYGRAYPTRRRQIDGAIIDLSDAEQYLRLDDTVCADRRGAHGRDPDQPERDLVLDVAVGDGAPAPWDRVTGDQLAPPRRARSVRVRDGKAMVTDGPFTETKEAVGGFDIIECGSLEEAVEIAAGHPVAQIGTIEVRPLWGK